MTSDTADLIVAKVASKLAAARIERGMSQREVATASGLDRKTISQVEEGDVSPKLTTLLLIAAVVDVDVAKIISTESKNGKFS